MKRVATVTLGLTAASLAYGFLAPQWYRSVLTVVPAKQQRISSGLAGLIGGGDLGGLAAGLDTSIGGTADGARIGAVLQSIAVTDAVIEKFDLRARYREEYIENARASLWRHCDVKILMKPNLVQLTCEDKDPHFVQQMLSYFAEYGNQVFRRVSVGSASEEVRFLEKRVAELRQQSEESAARMREFQESHKIVDLDSQAKAVVSALASLNSQRISKELELGYSRSFSSGEEATAQQLRSQLGLLDNKLRDLGGAPIPDPPTDSTSGRGRAGEGMFPSALAVPKLRAEYEALYRDRKVAEATLIFALERLEGAKASEARDVSTFFILDPPALPTRHSRPRRLQAIFFGVFAGLILGVGIEGIRALGGPRVVADRLLQPRARS